MKELSYHLALTLMGETKCFGPGPMQLLKGVEESGSLHQSAAAMGMSYSKAWKLLQSLEQEWGTPLLERHTGGKRGGGSALTREGKLLLSEYEAMLQEVSACTKDAFAAHFGADFWSRFQG